MFAIEETTAVQPDGTIVLQHPELTPGRLVKVILLLAAPDQMRPRSTAPPPGRKLRCDWGGALADLGKRYTSVELQHKAMEWWGH